MTAADIERAAYAPGEQESDGTQAEGRDALAWRQEAENGEQESEVRAG